MDKITKWALYLYLSVLTPFTAMACTSCSDNHNNDLEQMEENKNQHQDQNSDNTSGSYIENGSLPQKAVIKVKAIHTQEAIR